MWLYQTSGDTDKPIVLYEYQPGRGAERPEAFLKGYLHTDGYAGYHDLGKDITVVCCWAHVRRKFDEAIKSLPNGKVKGSSASQGLAYCNLLLWLSALVSKAQHLVNQSVLSDKLEFRLSALVSNSLEVTKPQVCHSERSAAQSRNLRNNSYICSQFGAKILRLALLAQDDTVIVTVLLIKADNHNSNI